MEVSRTEVLDNIRSTTGEACMYLSVTDRFESTDINIATHRFFWVMRDIVADSLSLFLCIDGM